MGNAFLYGSGGGSLSKCTIIVHIETGAAVAAYSDAQCTIKVKDGKEISGSGEYVITGLPIATYYIKAVKGTDVSISGAVTFTSFRVITINMSLLVPYEYQAVEFLRSSGTQYINTHIKNTSNYTKIKAEISVDTNGVPPFGSSSSDSSPYNFSGFPYSSAGSAKNLYVGSSYTTPLSFSLNTKFVFELEANNGNFTARCDSNETTGTYGGTVNNNYELYLFGRNRVGTAQIGACTIYRIAFHTSPTTLAGDFVPCYRKSDNVAGMWDRVSETFFTNNGTGTFVVGEPI